jgi:hypothetical protein
MISEEVLLNWSYQPTAAFFNGTYQVRKWPEVLVLAAIIKGQFQVKKGYKWQQVFL